MGSSDADHVGVLYRRATDEGDDSGNLFAANPFAWVIIPLVMFVVAALILIALRYRRNKRRAHGQDAMQQDLEAMRRPGGSNDPGRWQWPSNPGTGGQAARFGRRRQRTANREEGLNELGEAPPAYTPPRNKPDEDESIELSDARSQNSGQSTTDHSTPHEANPATGPAPEPALARQSIPPMSPPAYEEDSELRIPQTTTATNATPESSTAQTTTPPAAPQPAVVRQ